MNNLWKTTTYSILLTTILGTLISSFSVSFIGYISLSIIVLLSILVYFLKKRKMQIICYALLFVSYVSFWFDPKLLSFFSFNNGSILPIFIVLLLPYIGFFLYASDKDSGFKGTLQIRANYKIQDAQIVRKVNKSLIPYSLLSCAIFNFPLVFYFSKTYKVLLSFLLLCFTIIFIEIFIRILVHQKKKKERKEMDAYIEEIKKPK